MSYTRRYNVTVTGTKQVTLSHPASQNPGTVSGTVTINIPVDIDIEVNTYPFDASVSSCQAHVNGLTGAVVATEAAQVIAIKDSAKKISDTVINGFFGLIRSEISQQISEYKPRVDALTIELYQQHENCLDKQKQMGKDYEHIAGRYSRIFTDLDKEVHNRVKALSGNAFKVEGEITAQVNRPVKDIRVNVATVFNTENNDTNCLLFASSLKKKTLSLINRASEYLLSEKQLFKGLKSILFEDGVEKATTRLLPVLYMETSGNSDVPSVGVVSNNAVAGLSNPAVKKYLQSSFQNASVEWKEIKTDEKSRIEQYFISEINKGVIAAPEHDKRVSETMLRLFKNNHFLAPAKP